MVIKEKIYQDLKKKGGLDELQSKHRKRIKKKDESQSNTVKLGRVPVKSRRGSQSKYS